MDSMTLSDVETLPRDVLQVLAAIAPHGLLADIVRCAADDLVRDRAVAQHASAAATAHMEQLGPSWQALGLDIAALPSVYGAVCALVVQFARENPLGIVAQRQALLELGVDDLDVVVALVPLLVAAAPPVRTVLEHTRFDFAHVVDVTWRLDYVLRTSAAGSVHTPRYYVQLLLQPPTPAAIAHSKGSSSNETLERLTFTCSVDELRDIVFRLQEATNEIEKLVGGVVATSAVERLTPQIDL